MVKQMLGLGDLISCSNSFPKQVVAYLFSCHCPASEKDEVWGEQVESCGQSKFCCSCCQKASYGWMFYYWECLSFPGSKSHHHLWMEPSVVGEHVEHSQVWKSISGECPGLEQLLPIFSRNRQRQNSQTSHNIPYEDHSAPPNSLLLSKMKICLIFYYAYCVCLKLAIG